MQNLSSTLEYRFLSELTASYMYRALSNIQKSRGFLDIALFMETNGIALPREESKKYEFARKLLPFLTNFSVETHEIKNPDGLQLTVSVPMFSRIQLQREPLVYLFELNPEAVALLKTSKLVKSLFHQAASTLSPTLH